MPPQLDSRSWPFAHIIDARQANPSSVSARVRTVAAARLATMDDAASLRAEAFIVSSAFTRGALTALTWLYPPQWLRKSFTTMGKAEA